MKSKSAQFIFMALILIATTLTACAHPAKWAVNLEKKVKCDMSLKEVQDLTSKIIVLEDVPRNNRTHYIRSADTDVWFVFKEDKLKSFEVLWAEKMMEYKSQQPIFLCN